MSRKISAPVVAEETPAADEEAPAEKPAEEQSEFVTVEEFNNSVGTLQLLVSQLVDRVGDLESVVSSPLFTPVAMDNNKAGEPPEPPQAELDGEWYQPDYLQ